jgi:hypothetical protein
MNDGVTRLSPGPWLTVTSAMSQCTVIRLLSTGVHMTRLKLGNVADYAVFTYYYYYYYWSLNVKTLTDSARPNSSSAVVRGLPAWGTPLETCSHDTTACNRPTDHPRWSRALVAIRQTLPVARHQLVCPAHWPVCASSRSKPITRKLRDPSPTTCVSVSLMCLLWAAFCQNRQSDYRLCCRCCSLCRPPTTPALSNERCRARFTVDAAVSLPVRSSLHGAIVIMSSHGRSTTHDVSSRRQ